MNTTPLRITSVLGIKKPTNEPIEVTCKLSDNTTGIVRGDIPKPETFVTTTIDFAGRKIIHPILPA